jgi:excisionase family DNA binding protein
VTNPVLTVKAAAAYLEREEAFVYRLIHHGLIEARKVGREWNIPKRSIDEWLAPAVPTKPEAHFARRVEVRRRG